MSEQRLCVVPITLAAAQQFVVTHHRHHGRVAGHKYSVAITDTLNEVRGVAIVGRPVARNMDDGWTLEVVRLCTDGVKNGCSMLYSAAWRVARALGYRKLITYTLATEPGTSLRAAGWRCVAQTSGGSWSCPSRPRIDKHPLQSKLRWEVAG